MHEPVERAAAFGDAPSRIWMMRVICGLAMSATSAAALVDDTAGGVTITIRRGESWIGFPPLDALPEPANLQNIKDEVIRRWGTLDLLDVLKDSDYLADFTPSSPLSPSREVIDRDSSRRGCCCRCSHSAPAWVSAPSSRPANTASPKAALRRPPLTNESADHKGYSVETGSPDEVASCSRKGADRVVPVLPHLHLRQRIMTTFPTRRGAP